MDDLKTEPTDDPTYVDYAFALGPAFAEFGAYPSSDVRGGDILVELDGDIYVHTFEQRGDFWVCHCADFLPGNEALWLIHQDLSTPRLPAKFGDGLYGVRVPRGTTSKKEVLKGNVWLRTFNFNKSTGLPDKLSFWQISSAHVPGHGFLHIPWIDFAKAVYHCPHFFVPDQPKKKAIYDDIASKKSVAVKQIEENSGRQHHDPHWDMYWRNLYLQELRTQGLFGVVECDADGVEQDGLRGEGCLD